MHRILIADSLEASGIEILKASGAEVTLLAEADRPRLPEILADYDALVVRSMTKVTRDLIAAGKKLQVIGRAGIGVDNIDVPAATERGILVVNAPTANLMSACEHTFALLFSLARAVPAADATMKAGQWNRKPFVGVELDGKTMGIVGFGRIGQRVAERAKGFGMKVIAYDPFLDPASARRLDVESVSLDELFPRADVLTFHTPLTSSTKNLLSAERIATLKKGALVVNCARGGLLDEAALVAALDSGHLGGAALDVYAQEPPTFWELAKHPKVVATPHIGAQTQEAQERIAIETSQMVLAALAGSMSIAAVNLPFPAAGPRVVPFLALGERLGRFAGGLLAGTAESIQVDLWGLEEALAVPIGVAVEKGVLEGSLGEGGVNYVNAERLAKGRGLELRTAHHGEPADYPQLVRVTLSGGGRKAQVQGTLVAGDDPRVVGFEGFRLEFRPEGRLLVLENRDVPGVVGRLGTLLGAAGINIGDIHLARQGEGQRSLAVLRLDQEPPAEVLAALSALPEVAWARLVDAGR